MECIASRSHFLQHGLSGFLLMQLNLLSRSHPPAALFQSSHQLDV